MILPHFSDLLLKLRLEVPGDLERTELGEAVDLADLAELAELVELVEVEARRWDSAH